MEMSQAYRGRAIRITRTASIPPVSTGLADIPREPVGNFPRRQPRTHRNTLNYEQFSEFKKKEG
jgi:hypothetical protein